MRRLYVSVYLALVGHLVLFGALAVLVWSLHDDDERRDQVRGLAETIQEVLPPPAAPVAELQAALDRLRARFGVDLSVSSAGGAPVAWAGRELAAPATIGEDGEWSRSRAAGGRRGWSFAVRLPDGRIFVASRLRRHGPRWLVPVLGFALVLALVAYPIARRITRRLERLQARVDQLARGDLGARVEVEGKDEVARLARSFNHAAERIERLVGTQRTMLAAASHELRSPLARIRMAVELLESAPTPALRERVARDIAELDGLIEELLLASRLETRPDLGATESVDLLALAAEEGARIGAAVEGEPVSVTGDRRLLRHLVRNVVQNAARHGEPPIAIEVRARARDGVLRVTDRGPGIAPDQREAVFEPFYRPPGSAERGEGVGLGLAIVREIARRHGGEAVCAEHAGGGTAIEVRLPGAQAGATDEA